MASRAVMTALKVGVGLAVTYKAYTTMSSYAQEKHSQLLDAKQRRPKPSGLFKDRYFENQHGLWLFKRRWSCKGRRKGSVYLVHGYGEHCGRYHHVAQRFVECGWDVFAMDHQGHGQSEGDAVHVEQFQHYVDDVLQYVNETREEDPDLKTLPTFLVGHSMGALIASQTAAQSASLWDGVVLSGAPMKPGPEVASPTLIAITKFLARTLPKMPVKPLAAKGVCSDELVVEQYKTDPLVYTGSMKARWAYEMLMASLAAVDNASKFTSPVLLVHGEADPICDVEGSRLFMENVGSKDKQLIVYPNMLHEIFNEPQHDRVLGDVCDWLVDRT